MQIESKLDLLHKTVKSNPWLQLFTAFNRVLLGIGFIFPSIPKIMYRPFTALPDSNPVGHYFNALYQTGFYYQFIGFGQLTAAILILFPRTAHLGALLFFPIILNITVLTNSVGFAGTWLVTLLMSLSSLYLVCWDYDRWKKILFGKDRLRSHSFKYIFVWLPLVFAAGGIFMTAIFYVFGIGNLRSGQPVLPALLALAGLIFGIVVAAHHRFMKIGE